MKHLWSSMVDENDKSLRYYACAACGIDEHVALMWGIVKCGQWGIRLRVKIWIQNHRRRLWNRMAKFCASRARKV